MVLGARLLLGLALLAALLAVVLQLYRLRKPRLWTKEELAVYNGTDESLPILLGILGSVFDVTKGKSNYGPGGGYHHFAGSSWKLAKFQFLPEIDVIGSASTSFPSSDGLTDSLQGLSSMEVNSIVDWRKFYFERYIFAGKIVGRYYDDEGNPTKYLKGIEMKAKRGAQLLEKQKSEEAKIPSCNSKWSQQEGGEVWCETGYPRLVRRPGDIALTGQVSQRCACYKEEELDKAGLVVYEGQGGLGYRLICCLVFMILAPRVLERTAQELLKSEEVSHDRFRFGSREQEIN
uniref:Cytochrome b5 heme-binding domain-containing protein n=2 Tax=Oryza TaxID=4527 RepID=A0A0D3FF67_9ORYZ